MFTKKHSQENKEMLDHAEYFLWFFAKEYVIEDLQRMYPDVSIKRIRRIVDKAERIIRGRQIRKNEDLLVELKARGIDLITEGKK